MYYKPKNNSLEDIRKELENVLHVIDKEHMCIKDKLKEKIKKVALTILNKTETNIKLFEPLETFMNL
jgi:hypothetical protein